MEEIDLKDLWNYFLSKIVIVIVFIALSVLISNVYALWLQNPMYRSSATIVLTRANSEGSDNTGITQNDVNLNQKLVSTYSEIIKSRRILNKVISNLNLDDIYTTLSKHITVSNAADTELIRISVIDQDSAKAKTIANEVADVFSEEIVKIYNIQNISIIDYAVEDTNPYNINIVKQSIIAILFGIVLSCAIIFVMFYFDTTVKKPEEIEEKLGVIVLGKVPIFSKSKNKRGEKK